jgi:hypothetical protein
MEAVEWLLVLPLAGCLLPAGYPAAGCLPAKKVGFIAVCQATNFSLWKDGLREQPIYGVKILLLKGFSIEPVSSHEKKSFLP